MSIIAPSLISALYTPVSSFSLAAQFSLLCLEKSTLPTSTLGWPSYPERVTLFLHPNFNFSGKKIGQIWIKCLLLPSQGQGGKHGCKEFLQLRRAEQLTQGVPLLLP